MRRFALLGVVGSLVLFIASLIPSAAGAAFGQCPPVDHDTGCQFLFTVTDTETSVQSDPTQGPYEGIEDALIGIQNNSSKPLSSIPISAEENLFGFENDGICSPGEGPIPSGCVILTQNSSKGAPAHTQGEPCPAPNLSTECGFPEAQGGGEPKGVTYPEGILINGYGKNENPVTGYEGPSSWFTGIAPFGAFPFGSGVVNFSPAIPPGGSTYFSLESPPVGGFGSASTLTTTLSGGGQSGASISVVQGTPVTDSAALGGANAAAATGTVGFTVYSDSECKKPVTAAGSAKLAGGAAGPSSPEALAPGKYYWQASYGGSLQAQAVSSACASEVLTVLAPTSTSTIQTGGGVVGASIPVLVGSVVTDQAHVAGALAAGATGAVAYTLYKDKKCTVPAAPSSAAAVAGGVAGPSSAVKPKAGIYYWVASYTGDAVNAPSASACGSEVLIVSTKAKLNLPSNKGCKSKRRFVVHPKAPAGLKLVKVQVFINGQFAKEGRLRSGGTTLSLIGLPKGTFKVEFVAFTASGKTYEDTRTFHTCVTGHHKKSKKK
jgi:hypothetical protein